MAAGAAVAMLCANSIRQTAAQARNASIPMLKRLARPLGHGTTPILKHLAFVVMGGALLADALLLSAVAASSETTGTLLTAAPLYRLQFAAVATFSSLSAYADQFLDALNFTSVTHNVSAFASETLQDLFSFKIQLQGSEINIVLLGR
jgi:hypothetical protein